MAAPIESVQCFGRKKTAVAVTYCKRGRGLIKINGVPIELVEPEILRFKAYEPILLLGRHRFAGVDMRIRVKGGGHTSQIYAIRQSIAKALVAFYQKFVDEQRLCSWLIPGGASPRSSVVAVPAPGSRRVTVDGEFEPEPDGCFSCIIGFSIKELQNSRFYLSFDAFALYADRNCSAILTFGCRFNCFGLDQVLLHFLYALNVFANFSCALAAASL
ncbi:hypothetical protein EUGRSUZ_G01416 [Eucalyptus grandis]|uniref:Uncharacterized protein n=2 Tax=Eucalyptus grandis TaxID=71139 RepID=A0ACC3K2G9_EUCGR|nr:hypothetical protein EUGRSUZ_G01416 [Eucalyptus grandis]